MSTARIGNLVSRTGTAAWMGETRGIVPLPTSQSNNLGEIPPVCYNAAEMRQFRRIRLAAPSANSFGSNAPVGQQPLRGGPLAKTNYRRHCVLVAAGTTRSIACQSRRPSDERQHAYQGAGGAWLRCEHFATRDC